MVILGGRVFLMSEVPLHYRHSRHVRISPTERDWYLIAEQTAQAPFLAPPEGWAALRIVLAAVPLISRSCEHFPDGFNLHLLHHPPKLCPSRGAE